MKHFIYAFLLCAAAAATGCKDVGTIAPPGFVTQPINEDYSSIPDPVERWQAYHLTNYVYDQQNSCFCPYGGEVCRVVVRGNKVVDAIKKSDGQSVPPAALQRYKTVDELFLLVRSLDPDSVASLTIKYDARFGYPSLISVDPNRQIADEEYSYRSENIERLVK